MKPEADQQGNTIDGQTGYKKAGNASAPEWLYVISILLCTDWQTEWGNDKKECYSNERKTANGILQRIAVFDWDVD